VRAGKGADDVWDGPANAPRVLVAVAGPLPGRLVAARFYHLVCARQKAAHNLRRGGAERGTTSTLRTSGQIGLVACLALGLACSGPPDPPGRVLLVGIDGATLRIARPLLEEGRLPHLAAIASTGVYGPLRAHFPISSPRIWTSIATGRTPDAHGVLGFAKIVGEDERQLYLSTDRVVPALWNIASAAGLRVGVINWWNTYPIERVDGVIVSDHLLAMDIEGRRRLTRADTPTEGAIAWPAEWGARLPDLLEDDSPLVDVPDPFADGSSLPGWTRPERLRRRYQNDADVLRIALAVEAELRPDLMMVFFPGIDRVSHVLWAAVATPEEYERPPLMTDLQRDAMAEALRRYYVYTDALIGRLLESYTQDDLVLVVSDHGFEAGQGLGFLTGSHDSPRSLRGVIFARGPGVAVPERNRLLSVNDVTPTILTWLGLPVADDMEGRPAPFLVDAQPSRIPSYRDTPVERLAEVPSGAEESLLEQLRALGYLEDEASAARGEE
jgi:hypothetical protein